MQKENKQQVIQSVVILLAGAAIGAAVCALFLLLVSVAFSAIGRAPLVTVQPLAVLAAAVGAFVAGFAAARIARKKGYLFGLAEGLLLFAVVLLCGSVGAEEPLSAVSAIRLGCMLLAGMVGGMIGVNRKRKLR